MLLEELVKVGFSEDEARKIAEKEDFHYKRKTSSELLEHFQKIADVYGWSLKEVRKAIMIFPPFSRKNHQRVVRQATEVYGDEDKVKRAILRFPVFSGYDHKRVVRDATKVYGDEDKVKRAILRFPSFTSFDHRRVVRQATEVYGGEDRVKKAILAFPVFSGYDHKKVLRKGGRLGRIVGLSEEEVIEYILNNPILSNFSVKRYIAALDVSRQLEREGYVQDERMLRTYLDNYYNRSPYVPGHDRKRISQVEGGKEPQLLIKMRKSLNWRYKRE